MHHYTDLPFTFKFVNNSNLFLCENDQQKMYGLWLKKIKAGWFDYYDYSEFDKIVIINVMFKQISDYHQILYKICDVGSIRHMISHNNGCAWSHIAVILSNIMTVIARPGMWRSFKCKIGHCLLSVSDVYGRDCSSATFQGYFPLAMDLFRGTGCSTPLCIVPVFSFYGRLQHEDRVTCDMGSSLMCEEHLMKRKLHPETLKRAHSPSMPEP